MIKKLLYFILSPIASIFGLIFLILIINIFYYGGGLFMFIMQLLLIAVLVVCVPRFILTLILPKKITESKKFFLLWGVLTLLVVLGLISYMHLKFGFWDAFDRFMYRMKEDFFRTM